MTLEELRQAEGVGYKKNSEHHAITKNVTIYDNLHTSTHFLPFMFFFNASKCIFYYFVELSLINIYSLQLYKISCVSYIRYAIFEI